MRDSASRRRGSLAIHKEDNSGLMPIVNKNLKLLFLVILSLRIRYLYESAGRSAGRDLAIS